MSGCRRNFSKEQIIAGLKSGRTLVMDQRDAPELDDLLELERQGLVTQEFVVLDEQSSAVKWRWKDAVEAERKQLRQRLANLDDVERRLLKLTLGDLGVIPKEAPSIAPPRQRDTP